MRAHPPPWPYVCDAAPGNPQPPLAQLVSVSPLQLCVVGGRHTRYCFETLQRLHPGQRISQQSMGLLVGLLEGLTEQVVTKAHESAQDKGEDRQACGRAVSCGGSRGSGGSSCGGGGLYMNSYGRCHQQRRDPTGGAQHLATGRG